MPWSRPQAFQDHEVRVDDNHVPATSDGTSPCHVMGRKPKAEAPGSGSERWNGSGSERWPSQGWTEAGDGTNYPGLPTQAQADKVAADAEAEMAARREGYTEPAPTEAFPHDPENHVSEDQVPS